MKADELQQHILATYFSLRVGMVVLAFALPILLWGLGMAHGVKLEDSMSAYYHDDWARDYFVGILFTLGACLYLYKGYSRIEDRMLNIAGILAWGVALIPNTLKVSSPFGAFSPHIICAVLFFLCIAYVCVFRANDTLKLIPDEQLKNRYKFTYKAIGALMILSPLTALVLDAVLEEKGVYVFLVETVAVWTFATYWLVKSREFSSTKAEYHALMGRLEI